MDWLRSRCRFFLFFHMLSRFLFLVAATAGLHALAADQSPEDPNLKYFRDLAETRNFTLGRPVSPKITPDGTTVIFLRAAPRSPVMRLYELDIASGHERELLTPEQILGSGEEQLTVEEKARRERQRQSLRGFTSFQVSKDGRQLLVPLSGKLYVINRHDLAVTTLPGQNWIDPHFSPDGKFVAGVKDRELHVVDLATQAMRAITLGATDTILHGVSEFVAQEEMNRDEGYWWSPDSATLLYQETDESEVETRYIANALHPEEKPARFAYPRAGSPNAKVRLGLVARNGGPTRWVKWDATKYPYLARVAWEQAAAPLTLLVQNREQTEQCLLTVNLATGATTELFKETDAAWLNLDASAPGVINEKQLPQWLADGRSFLWTTESGGTWRVELRDATGKRLRELTPFNFFYRGLLAVDENDRSILVRGSLDSREVQLWRFPLLGGNGTQLTQGRGIHDAACFPDAGKMVHTFDLFDGRYGAEVLSTDGTTLARLSVTAEPLPQLPTTELTQTKSLPAFDAAITRPRNFSAGKKYPVILQVYAGPTSKTVTAAIRGFLPDQWMADQGYIVVRIDGRGTPWKGRDWERVIKGNFIDVALNDQVAGLQALATQVPEIDLSRVGVTGWSFGGYFSAMATIRRPDVFRAGVAGAPVITWENYDTHYTERYLGLPQTSPGAYKASDVTSYVNELRRPLMLVHGLTDDNVYFQHTLQLADALFMAGKPYELLPMLGTHMVSDPLVKLRQQQRIIEFFNLNLKGTQ